VDLEAGADPVRSFRAALEASTARLGQAFDTGAPVAELLHRRAQLTDALLARAWALAGLADADTALLAVGGYGRSELHPGSDIDIAVLVKRRPGELLSKRIEQFLMFLWDIGLKVGHSVRTPGQCRIEARADITVATNLMEARLVAGDGSLLEAMRRQTGPARIWPLRKFFQARVAAQQERHRKFADSAYNLEPNLKEGPGGLRDIQTVEWIARRHFGAGSLAELRQHGFLTEEELRTLEAGRNFLWQARYALHLVAGRREDRLLFDYQRAVARRMGFRDGDTPNHGVEQFMKMYYRTVTELGRLNEILLGLLQEALVERGRKVRVRVLNKRFQTHNDLIEVRNRGVFKRYSFALLEIFMLMQQEPKVTGIRASTLRSMRDHLHLIDENFRRDLRARSLFIEILRHPRRLSDELHRMQRYGVLGAYLPVYGAVSGLMQFDLFHVYTVDEHTLVVVRNMRRFWFPDQDTPPLCAHVAHEIPKPELLYIAGLFHDIGKGQGGDHCEIGAQEAIDFCFRHHLGQWDCNLVAWLVRHHLLMSITAQKKDVADPAVINDFAGVVGDGTHLNYLFLLTVADIQGTNPNLWTSWKRALLENLYASTLRALRRGLENPLTRPERIRETKDEVLAAIGRTDLAPSAVEALWQNLDEDYFLRHTPDEILWQAEGILPAREEDLPVVLVRPETERGSTEVFIYMRDRDHLFAIMTRTLDQLGLTIQDARIITSRNGYTLDTYFVLEAATGQVISSDKRAREIIRALKTSLKSTASPSPIVNRRIDRKLRHFSIPTSVGFDQDPANRRTVMEVVATDRPGLLARIGMAMQFCGVRLQNARIATFGERVEDIFFITDKHNQPVTDRSKLESLRSAIIDALADR
jgi:[protein-PII] uridylyltransferase